MIRSLLTYVMSNTNSPGQSQTALGKAPLGSSSEPSPASEWIHRWIPSLKALNVFIFTYSAPYLCPRKQAHFDCNTKWKLALHEINSETSWNLWPVSHEFKTAYSKSCQLFPIVEFPILQDLTSSTFARHSVHPHSPWPQLKWHGSQSAVLPAQGDTVNRRFRVLVLVPGFVFAVYTSRFPDLNLCLSSTKQSWFFG